MACALFSPSPLPFVTWVHNYRAEGAVPESLFAKNLCLSPGYLRCLPLVYPGNLLRLQSLRPKPYKSIHLGCQAGTAAVTASKETISLLRVLAGGR